MADVVPSRRGGSRQETERGNLGKRPWTAAHLLARELGSMGQCAEHERGPSRGGPHPLAKSDFLKLWRTSCRVEGMDPDSKPSAESSANTLGQLLVCLPGTRGRGGAAPSTRGVRLVGVRTPPKVTFEIMADVVPSRRGGPRQQTKRGILGKHPWAAGTRGRCAEQAGGRSQRAQRSPPNIAGRHAPRVFVARGR
jgi:hypothetical protein